MRSTPSFMGRKPWLLAASVTAMVALAAIGTTHRVLALGDAAAPARSQSPAVALASTPHQPDDLRAFQPGSAAGRLRCGLRTLHGSYVFTASGFNIVGGVAQPKTIIELLELDGHGNVDVSGGTVSINGLVTQGVSGVGIYTLDAECKGTLTFTPGPGFDIFVDPKGDEFRMIQTNPNTVFQGTVSRVSR